jgi:hypothetical protein
VLTATVSIAENYKAARLQPFYGRGQQPLLRDGWRAARRKITGYGIPKRLNYCEIFIVRREFLNVAAGWIPLL